MYIVAYAYSHPFKRVFVENGLEINVIFFVALERLNVPIRFLNAPIISIRAFNNTLATNMGTFILPVRVGFKEIIATYHVVEGEM